MPGTGAKPTGTVGGPLHVVQVGWDTTLFEADAASDSLERQRLYTRLLAGRRPGSRMTVLVLGAAPEAPRLADGNLVVEGVPGRWAGVGRLPSRLARLDRECAISVIATQSPFEECWASLAFARSRLPVVAQVHFDLLADAALPGGNALRRAAGRARRALALRLLPLCAGVRTVAPDMAARLLDRGAREARAIPVPVLDLDRLQALPVTGPQPRVLFVGRLAPEKNLMLWLEVAQRIGVEAPAVQFDIVGDGALRASLKARAGQLGLEGRITFHGARPRTELPVIYGRSGLLLLTSDHEGFGRVLVEAMAAGVPVVSTRTAGAREVLGEGEAGAMAAVGDAAGLAAAALRLLRDDAARAAAIGAGRGRVADRYQPRRLAGRWVDMLIEAADRPAPAGPR